MRVTGREVATAVAAEFGLTFMDLTKQTRAWKVSHPRQAAMYAVRRIRPDMSYPRIGRMFGGRDHTTVLHGIRQVEQRMSVDAEYQARITRAMAQIGGGA